MKRLTGKIKVFTLILSIIILFISCNKEDTNVIEQGFTVSKSEITIGLNKTQQVFASVYPYEGEEEVKWSSSNPDIASIEAGETHHGISTGKITGLSVGEATITVESVVNAAKKGFIKVQVVNDNFISSDLAIYPVPDGTPQSSTPVFSVTANQYPVGVFTEDTPWTGKANFAYFNLRDGYNVEVKITPTFSYSKVTVLPESLGITPTKNGSQLAFTVNRPNTNITLVFDDNYFGNTLHLFTNPIDNNAPTESDTYMIYFGPGYHDLQQAAGEEFLVGYRKSVYLAPGAVVNGRIRFESATNVSIRGSGVLMNSKPKSGGDLTLAFAWCRNVTIEGIILSAQKEWNWNVGVHESRDVNIRNLKVVSPQYASTDGINMSSCRDVTVQDCFIRVADDCLPVNGSVPNVGVSNILVENCILWNDAAGAMTIGAVTKAPYFKDITYRNIDVLFSHDDRENHNKLTDRGLINITCLDGTFVENITYENIRVNNSYNQLIALSFKDDFYYGSIYGDQTRPGGMNNIVFRNITVNTTNNDPITNVIWLEGYTAKPDKPAKPIENVRFENVVVNGYPVTANYGKLKVQGPVSGLVFQ